ncbi:MAG: hypothetical protein IJW23_06625, partial [Lentisphaeria bacterium]|nr:hypothetical protein [Lentisphaeria bacterium]
MSNGHFFTHPGAKKQCSQKSQYSLYSQFPSLSLACVPFASALPEKLICPSIGRKRTMTAFVEWSFLHAPRREKQCSQKSQNSLYSQFPSLSMACVPFASALPELN